MTQSAKYPPALACAADATAAKERAILSVDKEKHAKREKALSAQRDEAQGQLDRITAEAKPTNEKAMAALMPAVAQSNHEYDAAFAKLSDEDRSEADRCDAGCDSARRDLRTKRWCL